MARMRDEFESGELDGVTRIDGKTKPADALSKKVVELSEKLSRILSCGVWMLRLDDKWSI